MKRDRAGTERKVAEFPLEQTLRHGKNKSQSLEIVGWVGEDPRRFGELLEFLGHGERTMAVRAAWAASACVEACPELITPHFKGLLDRVEVPGTPDGVQRNVFRMLQFAPIPGDCEGRVMSMALAALGGAAPVAVKAYGMTVLKRLAGDYPEILGEIRLLIEEQMYEASPAFRARARMEFGIGG